MIATKVDLRDKTENAITTEEGNAMCKDINAAVFLEIDCKKDGDTKKVMSKILDLLLWDTVRPKKKSGNCNTM